MKGKTIILVLDRSQNVTDSEKCFEGMSVSQSIVTMGHSGVHTTARETVPSRSGVRNPSREQLWVSYPNLMTHPNLIPLSENHVSCLGAEDPGVSHGGI